MRDGHVGSGGGLRCTVALLAVALLYSNLGLFLFARELVAVPPAWLVAGAVVLAIPWIPALAAAAIKGRANPMVLWAAYVVGLALLGFVIHRPNAEAAEQLFRSGLAMTFLVALLAVAGARRCHRMSRAALAVVVMAGVALNLADWLSPMAFSAVPGRAAGLYINPNISGGAIAAGAVVAVGQLPPRLRALFLVIASAGVLMTLSRGALIAWVAGVGALLAKGVVSPASALKAIAGTAATAAVAWVGLGRPSGEWVPDSAVAQAAARLERLRPEALAWVELAPEDELRVEAASAAWRMFAESPLAGAGAGATARWPLPEGPHNAYLRGAAEHGVPGLALLPLLVVAIMRSAPAGDRRGTAIALATVLAVRGLFSHTVLEEWPILVVAAVAAGGRET